MGLWRYWRRSRELERERDRAYRAWRRAAYAYRDIVSIYTLEPGAWRAGTPIDQAGRAEEDARVAFAAARQELERFLDT